MTGLGDAALFLLSPPRERREESGERREERAETGREQTEEAFLLGWPGRNGYEFGTGRDIEEKCLPAYKVQYSYAMRGIEYLR